MQPSPLRSAIGLAIVVAAFAIPAASAQAYPFGSFVGSEDVDHTPTADPIDEVRLCFIDDDGSNGYDEGEPLILRFGADCDRVAYDDRCLVCLDGKEPGSEIETEDPEYDRALLQGPTHNVTYVDVQGEGGVDPDNPTHLDIRRPENERVDPGDIRLTGWEGLAPVSTVEPGDPDVGASVDHVTGEPISLGDEDILFEAGEGFYLNTDGGAIGEDIEHVPEDAIRLDTNVVDRVQAVVQDQLAESSADAGEPEAVVTAIDVAPPTPRAGEMVHVMLAVANEGEGPGADQVTTALNGRTVDVRGTPPLAPGEQTVLVLTLPVPGDAEQLSFDAGRSNATVEVATDVPELDASSASAGGEDPEGIEAQQADTDIEPTEPEQASTPALPLAGALAVLGLVAARTA